MEKIIFDWVPQRIDKFLSINFWYSRNFFHHLICRWAVKVDDKIVKKSYKLKSWDEIIVDNMTRFIDWDIREDLAFIDLDIFIEKKDYIVLYKPKWVLSHPSSIWDLSSPSVVWFLLNKYKFLPSLGNFIRSGLIHRLDKETDGPMLIAKTEKWLSYFKNLFQNKTLEETIKWKESISLKKEYIAQIKFTNFWEKFFLSKKIPFYIEQDVIPKTPNPKIKKWITKVLWFFEIWNKKYLHLEILTGRTHQIRYHLWKNWAEIIWDYLYNFWNYDNNLSLQLSCYSLEFKDIESEKIKIINPHINIVG